MVTTLYETAAKLQAANSFHDVFGELSGTPEKKARGLKRSYRTYAKLVHPDLHPAGPDKVLATAAFDRLQMFYNAAQAMLQAASASTGKPLLTITTRKGTHCLERPSAIGDLCQLYVGTSELKTGNSQPAVYKVAIQAADNDLLQAEATAIRRLRGPDGDPQRHPFVPELLDTFSYAASGQAGRQVNVLAELAGFYTLEQVHRAFPSGLPVLHMAWMWRRLLLVLGYAHQKNIVHGAVLPAHVMILPSGHGLVLVDWCYSVQSTDNGAYPPVKALVEPYRSWYPGEVLGKQTPSAATDVYMAARCMVYLLGGDPLSGHFSKSSKVPVPFQAFFAGCMAARQQNRPQDAWALIEEFDELLERLGAPYFPRRFREFTMPTGVV